MTNTIPTRELSRIIDKSEVVSECSYASIDVDVKDLYFSASLNSLSEDFDCALWVGDNEEEIELTEEQKDQIYYHLLNTESQESQFDYSDHEHAITLIHS